MPVDVEVTRLIAQGDIAAAQAILRQVLTVRPDDQQARMALFQLLCVEGSWSGAKRQCETLAQLSPDARMHAVLYGRTLDAEVLRSASIAGEAPVPLLGSSASWIADLAGAFGMEPAAAAEARARAFAEAPDVPGDVDGRSFEYIFDGDGRFGPVLEAIVGDQWWLLPFCAVEEIESEGPTDLRDLVWLPARIRLRDGGALAAMLPVRYPGTECVDDAALRLARRTEWAEAGTLVIGSGQRVWTTSGGEDVGILSFRRIRFGTPA